MVDKIVARYRMDENHKPRAMRGQPDDDLLEKPGAERQLATPVGVRTHRFFVHAAHFQRKLACGGFTQGAGLYQGCGVVVDVRVVAHDLTLALRVGG